MNDKKEKTPIPHVIKKAVAVKYENESIPRVVATGEGSTAEKIIEIAEEHGVVLYADNELVKLLSTLDLEEEIPNKLYEAIAAVLAFVYNMNGKAKNLL